MCPIIDEQKKPYRPGRPKEGLEARSVERKIRLEPYLDMRLGQVCRVLGISRSEAIRQGIGLFLQETKRRYGI